MLGLKRAQGLGVLLVVGLQPVGLSFLGSRSSRGIPGQPVRSRCSSAKQTSSTGMTSVPQ